MIALLGQSALIFAMLFAFVQGLLPLWGYARKQIYALALARPCALGQAFFVILAYAVLTYAFMSDDFSLAYVAQNSHATLPLMYKLTAVWGAHEGSILFWIVVLNAWTLIFSLVKNQDADRYTLTLAILGLINFCFLVFLFFTSNPFLAAPDFSTGQDLSPLLQDPGFVIHPPMLYTGYVGFSVAFAITLASLICGKMDTEFASLARRFALAAWCFLTLGISLGSWWAYRVLGWGGFWFWDPVENASLLPWLAGTALIHILVLCEKRNTAKAYAAMLAIITFTLSLLGTFLVRSGVLISVHTFASDPTRGIFLLLMLSVLITLALLIYIRRAAQLTAQEPVHFSWLSRDMALIVNSVLLLTAMATILLGTLYPLILDALQLGTISVGAPYFNQVMTPLLFILMFFMGAGVLLHWQQESLAYWWQRAWKKMLIACISAAALLWGLMDFVNPLAWLTLTLSFWILSSVQKSLRFYPGMALAHAGFAILVIGIMLSGALNQEREVRIQPGESTRLGPYVFRFQQSTGIQAENYRAIRAQFEVSKNNKVITHLYPEKRIYLVRNMIMGKVAIHPSLFRDLYIALGEPLNGEYWSVRIYYKPFVRWIWFGGLIMMLGGIATITKRKE